MTESFRQTYGPWAVITGASSGIGLAAAQEAAARGLHVVLSARSEDALQRIAGQLTAAHGVETRVLPLDLAQPDGPTALLEAAGSLDAGLLINSAGFGLGGPLLDHSPPEEIEMVDLNCRALLALTHGFAARFAQSRTPARRRSGIVLLSSLVAFQGVPRSANYAATKAYVQSLAEGLHDELKPLGIDVLGCAPGPTATGFGQRAGMSLERAESPERVAREMFEALGRRRTLIPGPQAKFLFAALSTAPRSVRVAIMSRVMRGMTGG